MVPLAVKPTGLLLFVASGTLRDCLLVALASLCHQKGGKSSCASSRFEDHHKTKHGYFFYRASEHISTLLRSELSGLRIDRYKKTVSSDASTHMS